MPHEIYLIPAEERSPSGMRLYRSASFWIILDRRRKMVWNKDTFTRFRQVTHADLAEFIAPTNTRQMTPYHFTRLMWILASVDDPDVTINQLAGFATQRVCDEFCASMDRMLLVLAAESFSEN